MGLDTDLLDLLSHTATLNRFTGQDQWGNNTYAANLPIKAFTTSQTDDFPAPDTQNRQRSKTRTFALITDALDIKVGDKITVFADTGTVTNAVTYRDETQSLMQEITITTQEEV